MNKLVKSPSAARYLKSIEDKSLKDKFGVVIDQIRREPYFGEPATGDLSGLYFCNILHNKNHYELIYTIIEGNSRIVIFVLAGTWEDLYQELKQYMEETYLSCYERWRSSCQVLRFG